MEAVNRRVCHLSVCRSPAHPLEMRVVDITDVLRFFLPSWSPFDHILGALSDVEIPEASIRMNDRECNGARNKRVFSDTLHGCY